MIQCSIINKYRTVTGEIEFGVINPKDMSVLHVNEPYIHEVGIEDWLHLMVEFEKSKYALDDFVSGLITFKKVSLKLKFMELQILKKETIGVGK